MQTVSHTIDVNVQPYEAYQWWRGLTRLPAIMPDVVSVEGGVELTHWKVRGPLGKAVEWDARIVEDRENEAIAWATVPGADNDVETAGRVEFEPVETGTRVKVSLSYEPTGGALGATVAKALGTNPQEQVERALVAFKESVETGGSLAGGQVGPGRSSTGMTGSTTGNALGSAISGADVAGGDRSLAGHEPGMARDDL